MRAVVSLSGRWPKRAPSEGRVDLLQLARSADILIAADGGLRHFYELETRPDFVVGDFDSADEEVRRWATDLGVEYRTFDVHKDMTDGELAITEALARLDAALAQQAEVEPSKGSETRHELWVLTSFAPDRPDHVLGNLFMTDRMTQPMANCADLRVCLTDGQTEQYLLRGPCSFTYAPEPGFDGYISVLPLSEEVRGLSYRGLEYPLTDHCLPFGSTLGISNRLAAGEQSFEIGFKEGRAVVCIVPEDGPARAC